MSGHKQNKCSFCEKVGHNVRSCERFKEVKMSEKTRQREEAAQRKMLEDAQRKVLEEAQRRAEEEEAARMKAREEELAKEAEAAKLAAEAAKLAADEARRKVAESVRKAEENALISKQITEATLKRMKKEEETEVDILFQYLRPYAQTSEWLLMKALWEKDRGSFTIGGNEWFYDAETTTPYVSITYNAFGGKCRIQYRAFGERVFSDKIHFTHITTFNKTLRQEVEVVRFVSKGGPESVMTSSSSSR